jgi:hypothetical protein
MPPGLVLGASTAGPWEECPTDGKTVVEGAVAPHPARRHWTHPGDRVEDLIDIFLEPPAEQNRIRL